MCTHRGDGLGRISVREQFLTPACVKTCTLCEEVGRSSGWEVSNRSLLTLGRRSEPRLTTIGVDPSGDQTESRNIHIPLYHQRRPISKVRGRGRLTTALSAVLGLLVAEV